MTFASGLPAASGGLHDYHMTLTRIGYVFLPGQECPPCPGWLAGSRPGLQLMRSRWVVVPLTLSFRVPDAFP
jgi:hypothetical protein